MSNRAPKINPTGTRMRRVLVWVDTHYSKDSSFGRRVEHIGTHSRPMKHLLKVMGEYILADYVVVLRTYDVYGTELCDLTCTPPLFPDEAPLC